MNPRFRLAVAAALVTIVACGDPYLHTNPYDPSYPVDIAISGPDTLFSVGEVGHYSVQTNPAWPDSGIVWAIDTFTDYYVSPPPGSCVSKVVRGDTALAFDGPGAYESLLPPLEPYSFKIAIEVWLGSIDTIATYGTCGGGWASVTVHPPRHIGYKEVVIMQRLTRIQLRCPTTHTCAPLAVGDTADIWVDGFDALNNTILGLKSATNPATGNPLIAPYPPIDSAVQQALKGTNPIATYVSRDSTIARFTPVGIRVAHVTAVGAGSTWIVATRGALADSLQIVVH